MATLAIAAAVNIGIALALNALFPPPDIEQEGPRLTELGFTGASYGKFIPITFGTDRVDGTIIDTQDPAIEEVVNEESAGGGLFKGGGPDVNTTTYTYFLTCRILFGIEGAQELVRLWADGKLIYDRFGTGAVQVDGINVTFYPGGADQDTDPEEVSRRGANIPAYGHLTSIKLDRLPLANFGNRIPNFTAEISYSATTTTSFTNIDELPAGAGAPGAGDYAFYDTERDLIVSLQNGSGGITYSSAMGFDTTLSMGGGSAATHGYTDGYIFGSRGTTNNSPLDVFDVETGTLLKTLGTADTSPLSDNIAAEAFASTGSWHGLKCILPTMGLVKHAVAHGAGFAGNVANGSWVDLDRMLLGEDFATSVLTNFGQPVTGDIWPTDNPLGQGSLNPGGYWIPDNWRANETSSLPAFGIMWWFGIDEITSEYVLIKLEPNFVLTINPITQQIGVSQNEPTITAHRRFAFSEFASGTGEPTGWALNITNGHLILCNNSSMMLYNPTDDIIEATRSGGRIVLGRNNYYSGSTMGAASGNAVSGTAEVFDTRTLEILSILDLDDVNWSPDNSIINEESSVWDDRAQALYISRNDDAGGISGTDLIAKLFLNRISPVGVGLDFINQKLATRYQRYEMGGLQDADVDVTDLSALSTLGYTINRDSSIKAAIQPLRTRYFFDVFQSDWIIKYERRGKTAIATIPEEEVGELKRGRDLQDTPPLVEERQDDLALPMRVNTRYKNKDIDYDVDVEHDKRYVHQNPTMKSLDEETIDIPIVDTPTNMKQTAQKWLWTFWNERISYKTTVPWTYLALDPSDVFNMGVFGETAVLRLAEVDIGAHYALGYNALVEDVKAFSSTIAGGSNLGFTQKFIGSSLPSRLFFLDCPLLSTADQQVAEVSNGYVAFGAFENGWPGATVFRSEDNNSWVSKAAGNIEAATAKVVTPPSLWGFSDDSAVVLGKMLGDFRNRIQEVSEGGTMTINPLRRDSVWGTVTEEAMYNGANLFAIITSSGVECIQYIDATVNVNGTITLERLLRGRLGTEDIASANTMAASDEIVVLADNAGVKQSGTISKQNILSSNLNTSFFYKGVTVGGLLEDAAVRSFTYTGRDIQPYSVFHVDAFDTGSAFTVTWQRRARGPQAAEWENLTGEVPLHEARERYTVEVVDENDVVGFTDTVDDLTSYTLSYSNAASVSPPTFVRVRQESAVVGFSSPNIIAARAGLFPSGEVLIVQNLTNYQGNGTVFETAPVTGAAVGDVLVVCVTIGNDDPTTITITPDPVFTFTTTEATQNRNQGTISTGKCVGTFHRVITASEPLDGIYDFTLSNNGFTSVTHYLLRFVDLAALPDDSTGVNTAGADITFAALTSQAAGGIAIGHVSSRVNAFPVLPSNFAWDFADQDTAPASNDEYFYGIGHERIDVVGDIGTRFFDWSSTSFNHKVGHWVLFSPEIP